MTVLPNEALAVYTVHCTLLPQLPLLLLSLIQPWLYTLYTLDLSPAAPAAVLPAAALAVHTVHCTLNTCPPAAPAAVLPE